MHGASDKPLGIYKNALSDSVSAQGRKSVIPKRTNGKKNFLIDLVFICQYNF